MKIKKRNEPHFFLTTTLKILKKRQELLGKLTKVSSYYFRYCVNPQWTLNIDNPQYYNTDGLQAWARERVCTMKKNITDKKKQDNYTCTKKNKKI